MEQRRANALFRDQRSMEKESPMLTVLSDNLPQIKPASRFGHAPALYVMGTDEDGPVKIGYTSDVALRVRSLQVGNPLPILVLGIRLVLPDFLPSGRDPNILALLKQCAVKLEKAVHKELHFMDLRLMGEWFDVSAPEALQVIDKVAANIRCLSMSRQWLCDDASRLHPEVGWIRTDLMARATNAEAQAAKVNQTGLTFNRAAGIL